MKRSWQTTVCGMIGASGVYLSTMDEPTWAKTLGAFILATGIGGMGAFARDNRVTSEQAGAGNVPPPSCQSSHPGSEAMMPLAEKQRLTWKEYLLWAVVLSCFAFIATGCVTVKRTLIHGDNRYLAGKKAATAECESKEIILMDQCAKREMAAYNDGIEIGAAGYRSKIMNELEAAKKKSAKDIHKHIGERIEFFKAK